MTRLDQALVERGLCESRERAKRAILAGQVRVNAQSAHKPSDSVKPDDRLPLTPAKNTSAAAATSWNTPCTIFNWMSPA